MSETYAQVAANGAGEKIAVSQLSNGAVDVDLQHVVIGDDTTYAARAKVQNSEPASTDYGLSIRRVCGGCSIYHVVAAGSGDAANIKASPGRVTGWKIYNTAGYPLFVKLHNTAGTPTPGAGVVYTIGINAGYSDDFDDDDGLNFAAGIGISIVKGIADANATAVSASDCVVNIHYK